MNLESKGYKLYKTEEFMNSGTSQFYQRKVDTSGLRIPLCNLNEALFLNITKYDYYVTSDFHLSYEISLTHENQFGAWCDLKIYSISDKMLEDNLAHYENQLLRMWKEFNK